ncbi:hypothetical protein LSCM1_05816 [Leishmania martiniquensis]|uniref:Uncharacterized protein n=1 Tax=Leishmania martiniquensis TaxID=1580590 RepID=A0A836KRA2_9TRYP|nr:hypothetical protein LSCM1_05816 [Leishmania martiniquensis]
MSLHTRTLQGSRVAATPQRNCPACVSRASPVGAIEISMANFLADQEAAFEEFIGLCKTDASRAPTSWRFRGAVPAAQVPPDVPLAPCSSNQSASLPSDGTAADEKQRTRQASRASIVASLLKQEKASQQLLAVGRSAAREAEELRRATELEEDKLHFAQARNRLLRCRLAALTRERCKGLHHVELNNDGNSVDVVGAKQAPTSPIGQSSCGYDYTNDIVEARRQLDQCTRELEEIQLRLHELQQYHLSQLSGYLRPVMTANDALRTTENFLDKETNMAVRATVIDSLLEVNRALKPLMVQHDAPRSMEGALPCLNNATTLWDRLAVQNFVVGRINRLLTCMCPTTPPVMLKDTNMMYSKEMNSVFREGAAAHTQDVVGEAHTCREGPLPLIT